MVISHVFFAFQIRIYFILISTIFFKKYFYDYYDDYYDFDDYDDYDQHGGGGVGGDYDDSVGDDDGCGVVVFGGVDDDSGVVGGNREVGQHRMSRSMFLHGCYFSIVSALARSFFCAIDVMEPSEVVICRCG